MELTRRDALAALAAGGVSVGASAAVLEGGLLDGDSGTGESDIDLDSLVAVARVVYPSSVEGVREFVETYALGRLDGREAYRDGVRAALAELDDYATDWYGDRYAALDREQRDSLLREMGVDAADPDPDGTAPERVRYYLVNELLYALYTTPTGGKLVGIENPQGYPGGTDSYQRGPGR